MRESASDPPARPEARHDPSLVETYAVSPDASDAELLAAAKLYAREVVARHDLTVSVSDLEWTTSKRAKRRAGAVRHRDGVPESVQLTREFFDRRGWAATAATIRHELVHVHLLTEAGDASHGDAFREWADRLDAPVRCERFADPKWVVECTDCGARLPRYRRSKLVKRPEEFRCGDCGGSFNVTRSGGSSADEAFSRTRLTERRD